MAIKYIKGNLFASPFTKTRIICHVNNDIGAWGAGFSGAISKISKQPELKYREWASVGYYLFHKKQINFELGQIQAVPLIAKQGETPATYVVNMIGQHEIVRENYIPIRYYALTLCLNKVYQSCKGADVELHCPKFGAGLAGGDWNLIEKLINEMWVNNDLDVTIYEL